MKKLISKIKLGNKNFKIIPKKRLIKPRKDIPWMSTHAGAPFIEIIDKKKFLANVYISGRSEDNKSRIGLAKF